VALFACFTKFGWDTAAVIVALGVVIWVMRHASFRFLKNYGETSSQIKLRFIFVILLFLGFVSEKGNLHASLAVFIILSSVVALVFTGKTPAAAVLHPTFEEH